MLFGWQATSDVMKNFGQFGGSTSTENEATIASYKRQLTVKSMTNFWIGFGTLMIFISRLNGFLENNTFTYFFGSALAALGIKFGIDYWHVWKK